MWHLCWVLFDDLPIIAVVCADILGRPLVIGSGDTRQGPECSSSRIVLARSHIDLHAKDTARDHRKIAAIKRVALPTVLL
jgi:hypothetical protein